jgi:hypothetical protein
MLHKSAVSRGHIIGILLLVRIRKIMDWGMSGALYIFNRKNMTAQGDFSAPRAIVQSS